MATNDEEAPPPYQEKENLNNDAKDDGNATATKTESGGEAKPKVENKPAPDGEGEFGAPLKRFMWIGALFLLYCILAFWLPVYWMDYYVNYCGNQATTYCDAAGSTDATCEGTYETACELIKDAGGYDALSLEQNTAGYTLMVVGIIFVVIGVILGYFGVKAGNRLYCQITAVCLGLGGLLSIVGIILIIAIPEEPENVALAELIIRFIEVAIPGIIAILLAYDAFNPLFLNVERNRWLYCTSVIFIVFGLMGGILFAYLANYEPEVCVNGVCITVSVDNPLKQEWGCIAAGYFIMAIMSLFRILIWEEKIKIDNPANKVMAQLAVAILICVGALIMSAGYWALIQEKFDTSEADALSAQYGVAISVSVPYESQEKCYYVAYTLFVLGIAIINAIDMGIVALWKACQAAQAAAGATAAAT